MEREKGRKEERKEGGSDEEGTLTQTLSQQPLSDISLESKQKKPKVYATLISRDASLKDVELCCEKEVKFGRRKDLDVVVKESTISGLHCIITPKFQEGDQEPSFKLKDLR